MENRFEVERFTLVSQRPFARVLAAVEAGVARPDMGDLLASIHKSTSCAELEAVVQKAIGAPGLMLFYKFDQGEVIFKGLEGPQPGAVRLLIGNPLTMASMARHIPDAGSYAPVTVLIDERPTGVHVSYDTMASLLAPYGSSEALTIAADLDRKIKALIQHAAC